jgi:3-oxoacyl-[acyl-carrier protein] reductase
MLLKDKTAVIYGGGGAIGGAVARAFAREGARVFLAGRTQETLDKVAGEIRASGGQAETARVDALDERAVDEHADAVAKQAGSLDISFNLISDPYNHGTPMVEMNADDYLEPVETVVRTKFLTWRAAARHMIRQGSGVILAFGGDGPPMRDYYLGGTQVAFTAVESMRRQLSAEAGPHGVRVITLRTGGIPETMTDGVEGGDAIVEATEKATMLGRAATLEDVANASAFAASDWGRTMTAATINVSCGALVD